MPTVGLGTWQYNDTTAYAATCAAFAAGYTYVDTAWGYGNEKGVGKAIADCWKGKREDLFVMTKVPGGLNHSETLSAHKDNLQWLGLKYVDHLMTHFPCDWQETKARCNTPRRKEEWLALESIYKAGLTRSIGISHYCQQHIEEILSVATVMPAVNQVEYHIGSGDVDKVIAFCAEKGIHFQSYSPLCGPCDVKNPKDSLINGELVTRIGAKYNVSGPQVSLRFIVQQALQKGSFIAGVIPKSSNPKHIAENIDLFGFELSEEDMTDLKKATQPAGQPGDCDAP